MRIQKIFFLLIILFTWLYCQESNAQVTGRVTDANQQPIPLVNIKIQETDQVTQTNPQGEYAIDAYPGDILVFSHLGMRAEEVRVTRNSFVIDVNMIAASIEIEEVEIKTKAKTAYKSQKELLADYPNNMNLIKTSTGILNKDLSSSFFRIIDGEDLVNVGTDFFYSFEAFIPLLSVIRNDPDNPGVHVLLRGVPPLFDVDGFLNPAPPTYLSGTDIDRIALLERNAAIARYGPQGARGVIVVNTKAQTWMDDMGVDRSEEHGLFMDSVTTVSHLEPYSPYEPSYLKKLQKVRSEKKALAIVDGQQSIHFSNPYYFLEMYELFLSRWGNNEKSKELSKYIIENFPEDIAVLKALAYIQQRYSYYLESLSLYLTILKSQSCYAQPLRDVANAYAEIGDIEKAWMYYTQYVRLMEQLPNASFDPYGQDQLIGTEMMNFLEQNNKVLFDRDTINIGMYDSDPRTRLVFEWNNPEAEFELQFVTPEGYYDTWSYKSGQAVLQNQVAGNGYTSHQFFLGKENIGLWQINIDYKGNNSEMPTYIKVSVYRDYGLPSQQIEINVYKLSKNHGKLQLFTFQQS